MDVGIRTFGQITSQAANYVQEPSVKFLTMLKADVNDELSLAAQKKSWPQLLAYHRNDISFTSGNPRFYCPRDVMTPLELIDETNQIRVTPMELREIFRKYAQTYDVNSVVFGWSSIGDACRERDFSTSAEKISISSSLAADTSKALTVLYKDSNGVVSSETITTNASNGTTAVQSSATMSDLVRISTSSTRTGVITITGVTSGVTYARIGPRENSALYKVLHLVYFPNGADTATLIYKRAPGTLVSDDDVPEIPVGQYLTKKAIAFAMRWMGKTADAEIYARDAEDALESHLDNTKDASKAATQAMPIPRPRWNRWGWGWRTTNIQ